MPIEPVKIPQNVYIEDRLFGPVTLRQVIITGIGTGISYMLWATAQNIATAQAGGVATGVSWPITAICWSPSVLFAIFAFVKINDLSMLRIVLLSLENMKKPSNRMWSPRQGIHVHIRTFKEEKESKKKTPEMPTGTKMQKMEDITHALDAPLYTQAIMQAPLAEETDPLERSIVINGKSDREAAPLPVNREKITASPMDAAAGLDGIAPAKAPTQAPSAGSVSIFRDLSPRTSHG